MKASESGNVCSKFPTRLLSVGHIGATFYRWIFLFTGILAGIEKSDLLKRCLQRYCRFPACSSPVKGKQSELARGFLTHSRRSARSW